MKSFSHIFSLKFLDMNRKLFASLCRINRGSGETSFVGFFVFNFHIIFPFLAKRIQSNASLVNIQEKYS